MTPRELDALVAEKVMGQCVKSAKEVGGYTVDDFFINKPDAKEPRWGHMLILPRYSEDIAAAWSVVEKMRAAVEGWSFCIDVGPEGIEHDVTVWAGDSNCHHAKRYDPTDGHGFTHETASNTSLPMAIVLAALHAHGVEVPA